MQTELIQVYIDETYKTFFLSKSGVDSFKKFIKLNKEYDLVFLSSKYLKSHHVFEITEQTEKLIKFKIIKVKEPENIKENVEKIKQKIKQIRAQRLNIVNKDNVPSEIFNEYTKLKKLGGNLPIPSPSEVLKNPDQYRVMISMALKNELVKKIPSNHPYIKYFKLLAKEIGFVDVTNELTELNNSGILQKIEQTKQLPQYLNESETKNQDLNDDDTEEEN